MLLLVWAKQGATVESIEHAYLSETKVPLPPIEEQHLIIKYVEEKAFLFDSLVRESERAINLLRERRSALISAAVTGKIDVRQLAAAEAA